MQSRFRRISLKKLFHKQTSTAPLIGCLINNFIYRFVTFSENILENIQMSFFVLKTEDLNQQSSHSSSQAVHTSHLEFHTRTLTSRNETKMCINLFKIL